MYFENGHEDMALKDVDGERTKYRMGSKCKANVSHWIAIEVPAKGYKISSSMHSKHFIYRTLSTLSTWQYQELDFRKVSIHALLSRGRIKISSLVEYWGGVSILHRR